MTYDLLRARAYENEGPLDPRGTSRSVQFRRGVRSIGTTRTFCRRPADAGYLQNVRVLGIIGAFSVQHETAQDLPLHIAKIAELR